MSIEHYTIGTNSPWLLYVWLKKRLVHGVLTVALHWQIVRLVIPSLLLRMTPLTPPREQCHTHEHTSRGSGVIRSPEK